MSTPPERIGIVGSGLIGQQWAMLFAAAGSYRVRLYDVDATQAQRALDSIDEQLRALDASGRLRGDVKRAEQMASIEVTSSLAECVDGAVYVQECVPERLDLKQRVFASLDPLIGPNCIVASSSSTLSASLFTEALVNRSRMLVAHPVNPPYYVRLVELVPSRWTADETMLRARQHQERLGQAPVTLRRDARGFSLNRIQYAILHEVWSQIDDGLLSIEDADTVMREGLGPRYAFMGPCETIHLNADGGVDDYCRRYGEAIGYVSETLRPAAQGRIDADSETARRIHAAMAERIPIDRIHERMQWRNERLAALAQLKKDAP